ncbi:MAG: SH3 domain-containing protein [Clostridia bacterium]|nr:SH3 domain-containing protein [Clostridia bacterium]
MKKVLSIIFSAVICLGVILFPANTKAAEADVKVGRVSLNSGWLNVRSSASASSESLARLENGAYITLLSKSGAWWSVQYGENMYGYSSATYIKEVSSTAKFVNISSGTLNIRSGAGTGFAKIGSLVKNEQVQVISTTGSWSYILYDGVKTGYVSSWYLSDEQIQSVKYPAVSLKVPSFKQTDSRWANVKLGSSGKTIAQIGCATTGIAMMESYRTGTTIYPDAMSKKLKYTSSGSVYWPSGYSQVSSSYEYLLRIYEKLKSGKPVLIGAKNKYGGQHWVVITGFKGGNTLSASNFLVNDPGSQNRATLQDLYNTHPNFYKYLYY